MGALLKIRNLQDNCKFLDPVGQVKIMGFVLSSASFKKFLPFFDNIMRKF